MDDATYQKFQRAFDLYWRNRADGGWHSQFEEKYDAALAAWINGWQKGFEQGTSHNSESGKP